jgi:hypothetical protein
MGGGHPGLAAIAARSEVSPINKRIVLTARAFCRPERGPCTAARFSSFATSLPPQSITRSQIARASRPEKRRLRIFAASVRMTRYTDKAHSDVRCGKFGRRDGGTMSRMSESAAKIKLFFCRPLSKTAVADTLQATGAEDRALQKCNLSADSGAKTRLGFESRAPAINFSNWDSIKAINPRGLGTCVREDLMDLLIERNQLG